jgi:hypothetical protein
LLASFVGFLDVLSNTPDACPAHAGEPPPCCLGILMKATRDIFFMPYPATTGMNPKASFGVHTLRFAGLFNLPISLHFAMEIGVSRIKSPTAEPICLIIARFSEKNKHNKLTL